MNDQLIKDDLVELFDAQTRAVPASPIPTDAIMGHGRSLKRRRSTLMAVAALCAVGGAGVAINYALSGTDQLAVSEPSVVLTAPETVPKTSEPSVVEPTHAPNSEPAVDDSDVLTLDDLSVEQRFQFQARPFRDGFLIPTNLVSDDGGLDQSTISFLFTTDGKQFQRMGADLTIDSDEEDVVVTSGPSNESVSVLSVSGGSSASVHLYQSTNLVDWTDQVLDVDFDTDLDLGLSPSLRRVLTPAPMIEQVALAGDRTVFTVLMVPRTPQSVLDEYGVSDGHVDERGLVAYPRERRGDLEPEVIATPEDLGLSAADIELISSSFESESRWLITVPNAGRTTVARLDAANGHKVFTAFGGSFVHVETPWEGESLPPIDAQIEVSDDGLEWTRFEPPIGPGEKVVTEFPLGDDLLLVTKTAKELKSYRVDRELTTEFLASWPIPDGYDANPGVDNLVLIWPSDDQPLPLEDADGGGILFMPVGEYDVTIDLPTDENPQTRYAIVRRETGEIVVENVVDDPSFLDGEPVDGQQVVRFTDANGRPEIVLSMDDLTGGSVPLDTPNIEIGTADGVTWHEVPRPRGYSWPIAANGNKVLVQWDDDDDGIIDLGELRLEVYELPE